VRETQQFSPNSTQHHQGPGVPGTPDEQVQRPYIESRDLFKIFKPADLEVVALRGVDLDVQRGELMAIVGASGSGQDHTAKYTGGSGITFGGPGTSRR
jgi:ABC-type glutathione transport system ATPase component